MLFRNILVAIGVICVFAGLALSVNWFWRTPSPSGEFAGAGATATPETGNTVIFVAARELPAGTLLRSSDIASREANPGELRPGQILRGQTEEERLHGAITQRDLAQGEALLIGELVMPDDRRFLSAVLRPGSRAVSISVDAPQSASGLVLPGDHVDVILTQNLTDSGSDLARKSVAETVLRNVRVIAVDQRLNKPARTDESASGGTSGGANVPKTVTLELNERQAEILFVAMQLGALQLSVRPLEGSGLAAGETGGGAPTWASDVSPALRSLAGQPPPFSSGSTLESQIRRPPAAIN